MRYASFAFVLVLAACGGPETLPWNAALPDCAPVGHYTCSCVEVWDTCGVAPLSTRDDYVADATEMCGSVGRVEDSGWTTLTPEKPAAESCWVRVWDYGQWQGADRGYFTLSRKLKTACPGVAPCEVGLSCTCVEKNP